MKQKQLAVGIAVSLCVWIGVILAVVSFRFGKETDLLQVQIQEQAGELIFSEEQPESRNPDELAVLEISDEESKPVSPKRKAIGSSTLHSLAKLIPGLKNRKEFHSPKKEPAFKDGSVQNALVPNHENLIKDPELRKKLKSVKWSMGRDNLILVNAFYNPEEDRLILRFDNTGNDPKATQWVSAPWVKYPTVDFSQGEREEMIQLLQVALSKYVSTVDVTYLSF